MVSFANRLWNSPIGSRDSHITTPAAPAGYVGVATAAGRVGRAFSRPWLPLKSLSVARRKKSSPVPAEEKPPFEWTWQKIAIAAGLVAASLGMLDGPWIGVLVGSIFLVLGLVVVFTLFGPYEDGALAGFFQAPGRLLLGALMIFLGGLGLVSGISDIRPSLVWQYPVFGDLRTLFWSRDRYRAMACDRVEGGPPAALEYAISRTGLSQIDCDDPFSSQPAALIAMADDPVLFDVALRGGRYSQAALDRELNDEARRGPEHRGRVEQLVAAGANPNVEIDLYNAVAGAIASHHPQLVEWLLENGAQANFTFADGRTLLDFARDSDRPDMRPIYEGMLLRHGAREPLKLEQAPQVR